MQATQWQYVEQFSFAQCVDTHVERRNLAQLKVERPRTHHGVLERGEQKRRNTRAGRPGRQAIRLQLNVLTMGASAGAAGISIRDPRLRSQPTARRRERFVWAQAVDERRAQGQ